ncbi:MAG: SDR family oxidoreductase [Alphaproteobacteria bacterium]|nr:SDR family oxidoreductase [Alphaproteobacteria bacterium]
MPTALVTGANRGIGLELVRLLHSRGYTVIAAVRTASPALRALGVRVVTLDLTNDETLDALPEAVTEPLDLLINNAGVLRSVGLDDLDLDLLRLQYEVNALGPLRVTAALRERLQPGAKVGIVTSRMGSIADNTSGSHYGYRMSKAAVNMAGKSLAHDLREQGVAVALLHPGWVRTGMTGGTGHVGPEEAARGLLARLDALTMETSGGFWHADGQSLPW